MSFLNKKSVWQLINGENGSRSEAVAATAAEFAVGLRNNRDNLEGCMVLHLTECESDVFSRAPVLHIDTFLSMISDAEVQNV